MKFKRTMAMVMATAMMLGLAACGGGSSSGGSSAGGDDEVKIAYIVKAKSDAFWTSMEDGAESFAEEKGIHLEFQAPEKETDVEKQVQMVENAVIKGFDAIVLSAADSNSLAPAIKKANDANIPVILVNDTMSQAALDEAGAHVETYVGIDQYEAAHQPVVQTPAAKVPGSAPAKATPAAPVRRRITVSIQEVTDESWQINNAAELDAYIEKLRHALKQKLDNGDTLNVDIW